MQARDWFRQYMHELARGRFPAERLDRAFEKDVEDAREAVREVLDSRRDVVVQQMDGGLQLWVERYRPPDTAAEDRDVSLPVAVCLDLEWDAEAAAIPNIEAWELVARAGEEFLADRFALTFEVR